MHGVMAIALAACDENAFVLPNPECLLREIWPALHLNHGAVGIIGPDTGEIEGAILLRIGHIWYSNEYVCEEKAIFVHPDFRQASGGRASRLCEFSKQMADQLGLPLVIGVLSNQRTEAKVRMYKRIFGAPAGAYFIYGGATGTVSRTEH